MYRMTNVQDGEISMIEYYKDDQEIVNGFYSNGKFVQIIPTSEEEDEMLNKDPEFKNIYIPLSVDLQKVYNSPNSKYNILIDDFLSFNEEKIFHIVNYCLLNNLKILITSNKKINEIKFKYDDLSSRLKTFSNLQINQANDEMLITILTKLLIEKQFIINSNDIFEYILRRVDRSYKGINDIVDKLDVLSLEKKRQLTIPLIKEIL